MVRKLTFVFVANLYVLKKQPLMQSLIAISGVIAVLTLDMQNHPFKHGLYDVLEETTALGEFIVLFLGILVTFTPIRTVKRRAEVASTCTHPRPKGGHTS